MLLILLFTKYTNRLVHVGVLEADGRVDVSQNHLLVALD